ncbi:MAG: DUF1365 domain-containing protein [Acidobacteriota bacterium]|nr:DUF1365 domain-containing protein [Acidobacteriota bacterium]
MNLPVPALYTGVVRHERFTPKPHRFQYRVYEVLVDVDDLDGLAGRIPFFSHGRPNVTSLDDRDYMGKGDGSIRAKVNCWLDGRGVAPPERLFLLTHLRVFGYAFNPVNYYYAFDGDGHFDFAIAEINNTFGEGYAYLLERPPGDDSETIRARFPKMFHISPFIGMDTTYTFTVTPPDESLRAHVDEFAPGPGGGKFFEAFFAGRRSPLTSRSLAGALLRHPMMPMRVMAWIHLHALFLLLKRVPSFAKPAPPAGALYTEGAPRSPFARSIRHVGKARNTS